MTSQSPVGKKISQAEMRSANERRRRFYSNAKFVMPPQPQFRRFAFAIDSGYRTPKNKVIEYWKSCPRSIRHPWELRDECLRFLPSAIYFTTSRFGNAKNVGRRRRSKLKGKDNFALNQFHGAELYFDLDSQDYGNSLTKAYEMAGKIIGWLSERGFGEIRLYFSGRGWHIHILDWEKKVMGKVLESRACVGKTREYFYRVTAFKLVNLMRGNGLVFDASITTDTRRVIRVPGSFNEKAMAKSEAFSTGNLIRPVNSGLYHALLDRLLQKKVSESPVRASHGRVPFGPVRAESVRKHGEKQEGSESSDLAAVTPLRRTMIEANPDASQDFGNAASLGQASRGRGDRIVASREGDRDANPGVRHSLRGESPLLRTRALTDTLGGVP